MRSGPQNRQKFSRGLCPRTPLQPVIIGDNCKISTHCVIDGNTEVGKSNQFYPWHAMAWPGWTPGPWWTRRRARELINNQSTVKPLAINPSQFYYQNLASGLLDEIKNSPEFRLMFEYFFPMRRYMSLAFLYADKAMVKYIPNKDDVLDETKNALGVIIQGLINSTDYQYTPDKVANMLADHMMRSEGGTSGKDPDLTKKLLRILLQTPLLILKGFVEVTDPAIIVAKLIIDAANLIQQTIIAATEMSLRAVKSSLDALLADVKGKMEQLKATAGIGLAGLASLVNSIKSSFPEDSEEYQSLQENIVIPDPKSDIETWPENMKFSVPDNVKDQIFDGLRRLEYRGYDSSGIATINNDQINCIKSQGNLDQLQKKLINEELLGNVGIGHTRWATHGVPNEANAHPHITDEVAVVHNGIIENFSILKNQISETGINFKSETDTEAIAHLITLYLKSGMGSYEAIRATTEDIKGSYALAIIVRSEPNKLYAVRKGSPLAIGSSDSKNYIGSDGYSLGNYCNEVTYLKDGDIAIIKNDIFEIFDNQNEFINRKSQIIDKTVTLAEKGVFKHFMSKEIHEQPSVIQDSISHYINNEDLTVNLPKFPFNITNLKNITLVACGSSYYSGLVAREWFEKLARVKVDVEIASEFRYREAPMDSSGLTVFISQSGETADTLAALKHCKKLNQKPKEF